MFYLTIFCIVSILGPRMTINAENAHKYDRRDFATFVRQFVGKLDIFVD